MGGFSKSGRYVEQQFARECFARVCCYSWNVIQPYDVRLNLHGSDVETAEVYKMHRAAVEHEKEEVLLYADGDECWRLIEGHAHAAIKLCAMFVKDRFPTVSEKIRSGYELKVLLWFLHWTGTFWPTGAPMPWWRRNPRVRFWFYEVVARGRESTAHKSVKKAAAEFAVYAIGALHGHRPVKLQLSKADYDPRGFGFLTSFELDKPHDSINRAENMKANISPE